MSLKIFVIVFLVSINYCLANNGLIVNGHLAPEGSFQYSVSWAVLCVRDNIKIKEWRCGGSVLTQRVVLSAAHCSYKPCKVRGLIKVGNVDTSKARNILISHYKMHPKFDKLQNSKYDIILIFLEKDIVFDNVKKVALMKNPPHKKAYVAGWGRIHVESTDIITHLRYAEQIIMKRKTCKLFFAKLRRGTICAVGNENEKGSSDSGDSGSALVVQGYIQVGIASSIIKEARHITVYTYIPYYLKWIKENVNLLYCPE